MPNKHEIFDNSQRTFGKIKKEDKSSMAKQAVDKFYEEYGEHWMSVVGDNHEVDVGHVGNFAHFNMGIMVFYKAA